jgi:hypothetical protein
MQVGDSDTGGDDSEDDPGARPRVTTGGGCQRLARLEAKVDRIYGLLLSLEGSNSLDCCGGDPADLTRREREVGALLVDGFVSRSSN